MSASAGEVVYRERLTPSVGVWAALVVVGVMVAVAFGPLGTGWAVGSALVVTAVVAGVTLLRSPVVEVRRDGLWADGSHLPTAAVGAVRSATGEERRFVCGAGADARTFFVLRGWIPGVVVVDNVDATDPVPQWVVSTRRPDRVASALRSLNGRPVS